MKGKGKGKEKGGKGEKGEKGEREALLQKQKFTTTLLQLLSAGFK